MHGALLLSMQPNMHTSEKTELHVLCLNAIRVPILVLPQPVLPLKASSGLSSSHLPPQQVWRQSVFSLLCTNSAVKALIQVVEESNSTPTSAPREYETPSPIFWEVVLAFRFSLPVESSHSLWNICILPKITTTLKLTRGGNCL